MLIVEVAGVKESMWEHNIIQRLTDKIYIVAFATTPKGKIWTHKLHKYGLHPDSKRLKSFLSKSIDNTHLDKEEIKAAKYDLSKDAFDMNIKLNF